jgi:two-component system, NarL family, response regulator DegU
MNHRARVVLADDHALMRDGLARSLEKLGYEVVAEVADGRSAVAKAEEMAPDLALMDVSMPVMDGLSAARTIHLRMPNLPIVMLSMHDEPEFLEEARQAGAIGYVTKDCTVEELAQALSAALATRAGGTGPGAPDHRCEPSISERELEVLSLLAEGANTAEIGQRLYISQKTVKNHLYSIYQKLEVGDRTQAVLRAMRIGLVRVA